jgi:peptidyl-prolyl cis-trans isomerase D
MFLQRHFVRVHLPKIDGRGIMNFQTGIGGWAVKILLGLLILSFAIWGVEDMLFKQARNVDVAKVGDVTITTQMLGQAVRREEENLRASLGNQYSHELMQKLNLEEQVLDKLINRNLIQTESFKLALTPSDQDILEQIRNNPVFQGASGTFDKEQFLAVLRRNNLNEKSYVEQLRQSMASNMLMDTIGRVKISDSEIIALYRALQEARSGKLYTLSQQAVDADTPDDTALEAFHRENSSAFTLPEYRSASYVVIKGEDIKKSLDIRESDLEAVYQERIEEFKRGEQRNIQQLLFDNEASADKASEMLAAGKSLDQVAKESGAQGKKPISMGLIEQSKMIAEAADEVFDLEVGKFSQPIKSAFGWHIFYVSAIEPPRTLAFAEVKQSLETDAKHYAADRALTKLTNQIEDALASGSSLAEVAKEVGLEVKTLASVDKNGKTPAGVVAKDLPDLDKFLDILFATDEKTDSGVKSSKGGNFYLLRTESVTPEHVQPLADVKARVIEAVKAQNRRQKLAALANEISSQFTDSNARAGLITKYRLKETGFSNVKRSDEKPTVPDALLSELFDKRIGESTSMAPSESGDYVLAMVKDITPSNATPSAESLAELRRSIEESTGNEMMKQYMDYLKTKHGVTVNQTALESMRKAAQ